MADIYQIIHKLSDRTDAGKIVWKPTYDAQTFISDLQGSYVFEIQAKDAVEGRMFDLVMKDREGNSLVVVEAKTFPPFTPDDELYGRLEDLHARARRIALDVDRKLDDVSRILDSLD